MSESGRATRITLRALEGTPLSDEKVRDLVIATAHSIAERNAVTLLDITATGDRIIAVMPLDRLAAIGFAAELRRLTDRWYQGKFGRSLWGEAHPTDPDESSF